MQKVWFQNSCVHITYLCLVNIIIQSKQNIMKRIITSTLLILLAAIVYADGYEVGDKATDFQLKNIDGKMVSMGDFDEAKGIVIIFTSNHCSTSKDYESLIIALDAKYKGLGFPVIAINPSDPDVYPKESHGHMVKRAEKSGFTFPYLSDPDLSISKQFGPIKIPQAFLLEKVGDDFIVRYIGQIDAMTEASKIDQSTKVLSNAINALLEGNLPDPDYTRPGGCKVTYETD